MGIGVKVGAGVTVGEGDNVWVGDGDGLSDNPIKFKSSKYAVAEAEKSGTSTAFTLAECA